MRYIQWRSQDFCDTECIIAFFPLFSAPISSSKHAVGLQFPSPLYRLSKNIMYFPHRGCVRTLRTLYVYATGYVNQEYCRSNPEALFNWDPTHFPLGTATVYYNYYWTSCNCYVCVLRTWCGLGPMQRCEWYWRRFLPRDAVHKRGICCHPVSIRPSVTFVSCAKTNKDIF